MSSAVDPIISKAEREARFAIQRANKTKPKFILLMKGFACKDDKPETNREQHFLSLQEIQHLIMACFISGHQLPIKPDWFRLERSMRAKKVGIFLLDFDTEDLPLKRLAKETVRFQPESGWVDQLLSTNLSRRVTEKIQKDDVLRQQLQEQQIEDPTPTVKRRKFSKLDLLLSPTQMLEEGYLFPKPMSEIKHCTRRRYLPVTENSPMFALDCEMVQGNDNKSLLARVSIVDEDLNLVLDTLVKPEEPIKNYLTRWSGVTKEMLDPVDITLADVKKILKKLIPRDAILCGQSLNGDLKVLKTFHPYVIDTSVIFNLTGFRSFKTGLAVLSAHFLGLEIQKSKRGHCSVEDARATMQLVKLKLEKGPFFADAVLDTRLISGKTLISLGNFFHLYESDVKVYYDYTDTENTDRFISVLTSKKPKAWTVMSSLAITENSICIILTREGYCYINVS